MRVSVQMEADKKDIDYRFRQGILEVQQRVGYKNHILEKKLSLIHNDLETKETQLGEVLASAKLDPSSMHTVTHRMEVKNTSICVSLLTSSLEQTSLRRNFRCHRTVPSNKFVVC